jgi:Tol biopolymer transport system component
VLTNALDPAVYPDGTLLAYIWLSDDSSQMALKVAALDGSNARQVLDGSPFPDFFTPTFSPDGKQIVVAAVGGPPTDAQGYPRTASRQSPVERMLGALGPPAAHAQEAAWELWIVNLDGTGLRRLTAFAEGEPVASFSPDGKQIAVLARGGIYLLNSDGSQLRRIETRGGTGGLEWIRK